MDQVIVFFSFFSLLRYEWTFNIVYLYYIYIFSHAKWGSCGQKMIVSQEVVVVCLFNRVNLLLSYHFVLHDESVSGNT